MPTLLFVPSEGPMQSPEPPTEPLSNIFHNVDTLDMQKIEMTH